MSKWNLLLLSLALTFGVTACRGQSSPQEREARIATERVAEAPAQEAAAEAPAEAGCDGETVAEVHCSAFCFAFDAPAGTVFHGHEETYGSMSVLGVTSESNSLTVDNGDMVQGGSERDADGTGLDYLMIIHGQDSASLDYSSVEDRWKGLLLTANTVVASVGKPGPNVLTQGQEWQYTADVTEEDHRINVTMQACAGA